MSSRTARRDARAHQTVKHTTIKDVSGCDAGTRHDVVRYDGRELRRVRQERGISQQLAASILGVSPASLSDWERGKALSASARRRYHLWLKRLQRTTVDGHVRLHPRGDPAPPDWYLSVRPRRKAAGLTVPQAAGRARLSKSTWTRYELGRSPTPLMAMHAMERALAAGPAPVEFTVPGWGTGVRERRHELGVSMQRVSLMCGVSQMAISEYERECHQPSLFVARRIEAALRAIAESSTDQRA